MKKLKSMTYLIIGMVLTAIGIIFTVIGTIRQENETEEFQREVIKSQNKSIELSEELKKISEEKYDKLTKPEINIMNIEEESGEELQSKFKIKAKNTGNNDCFNAKLIIDKHNSPYVGNDEIQKFTKIPKDSTVEFTIPMYQSFFISRLKDEKQNRELKEGFYSQYRKGEMSITVFFHFEYEWEGKTFSSNQFILIKNINKVAYATSSQNSINF